jgi:hypothetical protein
VPDTPVATEVHQPLDAHGDLTSQVSFYRESGKLGADAFDFRLAQILDLDVRLNSRRFAQAQRPAASYPEYVREGDADVLVRRNIYASYTCHS